MFRIPLSFVVVYRAGPDIAQVKGSQRDLEIHTVPVLLCPTRVVVRVRAFRELHAVHRQAFASGRVRSSALWRSRPSPSDLRVQ